MMCFDRIVPAPDQWVGCGEKVVRRKCALSQRMSATNPIKTTKATREHLFLGSSVRTEEADMMICLDHCLVGPLSHEDERPPGSMLANN